MWVANLLKRLDGAVMRSCISSCGPLSNAIYRQDCRVREPGIEICAGSVRFMMAEETDWTFVTQHFTDFALRAQSISLRLNAGPNLTLKFFLRRLVIGHTIDITNAQPALRETKSESTDGQPAIMLYSRKPFLCGSGNESSILQQTAG